jgi:threonine dehydratase
VTTTVGEIRSAVDAAAERLAGVIAATPLQRSKRLSERFGAEVLLKREDLQEVRSFKLRGAYNKIASLSAPERLRGVVAASAGNHAQGVAYACASLGIAGTVLMPATTPPQKIERVRQFGRDAVTVELVGQTYDEAGDVARERSRATGAVLVHPFDDPLVIAGQGTVAREMVAEAPDLDVVISAIGGGGLAAGIGGYLAEAAAGVRVIGAEPQGAASMQASLTRGEVVELDQIDTFVDGAAVRRVGELSFAICRRTLDRIVLVPEGQVCTTLIELYQNEGIIAEPAGALSVAALEQLAEAIRGKRVACVISGGNNDVLRYPEIVERSLVHQGRKHYFIVEFAQKPGQLRRFVDQALGPHDDIVRFEYMKKTNKERGAALVGIELRDSGDLEPLLSRMTDIRLSYRRLTAEELLYDYLI